MHYLLWYSHFYNIFGMRKGLNKPLRYRPGGRASLETGTPVREVRPSDRQRQFELRPQMFTCGEGSKMRDVCEAETSQLNDRFAGMEREVTSRFLA